MRLSIFSCRLVSGSVHPTVDQYLANTNTCVIVGLYEVDCV